MGENLVRERLVRARAFWRRGPVPLLAAPPLPPHICAVNPSVAGWTGIEGDEKRPRECFEPKMFVTVTMCSYANHCPSCWFTQSRWRFTLEVTRRQAPILGMWWPENGHVDCRLESNLNMVSSVVFSTAFAMLFTQRCKVWYPPCASFAR